MTLRPHRPPAPPESGRADGATAPDGPNVTSNLTNSLKTWTLLAALGGLLIAIGGLLGGQSGLVIALVFAVAMNVFVYWKSDSLALKANGARELRPDELPQLRAIVADLAQRAGLPMPRLYLVDRPEPNAFATGRDPAHAAVAVTSGILTLMDERELRGVLAHELSHVKNRDTLIGTIAATIGGAISFLAQMAQFQLLFGGRDDRNGGGGFGAIIAIIAIGSEPGSRLGPDAIVFLTSLVAVTGAVGIVMLIRTLLKTVATMSTATAPQPAANTASRALPNAQPGLALPPPRQPASVVEHTTAHLPNYVRPARDTGEQT